MAIVLTDSLVPGGDSFGTTDDTFVVGGFKVVATTTIRDAIPASRRKEGMEVKCLDTGLTYQLGSDLTTWTSKEYLLTTPQTLSDDQQVTARENLKTPALPDVSGFPAVASRLQTVGCGGYLAPASGVGFGMNGAVLTHTRVGGVNFGNDSRINNSGTVTAVRFFVPATLPADCEVWIHFLRENTPYADRWEMIGSTGNLRASVVANDTAQTVVLATPVAGVEIGDCTGFELKYTAGSWGAGFHVIDTPQTYTEWTARDLAWSYSPSFVSGAQWSLPGLVMAGKTMPVIAYMDSPVVTIIGDSRCAGYPFTRSLINSTQQYNRLGDVAFRLESLVGLPCRNVGIEGNTTAQMAARFGTDVLDAKPAVVVIMPGGYNDLYGGLSEADYTANVKAMIDAAIADGVGYILVCSDMPFADPVYAYGSHNICIQNAAMDTRCANIKALVDTYDVERVRFCDLRPDLGTLRPSDYNAPLALDPYWSDFNVWDLKELFWSDANDRLHMSEAGASQLARTIAKSARDWFRKMNVRTTNSVNNPVVYVADPNAEALTPTFSDLPCVAYKVDGTASKFWDTVGLQWLP